MEDLSSSIIDNQKNNTKTTMEDSIPFQNETNKNNIPPFIAGTTAIMNTTVSNKDQIKATTTTTISKPNIASQDHHSDKNTQQQPQLK